MKKTWHIPKLGRIFKPLAALFSIVISINLLVGILSLAPGTIPKASAANNATNACKAIFVRLNPGTNPSDVPNDAEPIKVCIKGYNASYDKPNENNPNGTCVASTNGSRQVYCTEGYKQGRVDKLAEVNTPPPASSQVKEGAEKACQPYKDQSGISNADRTKNFDACVKGYMGKREGKDRNAACESYSGPSQNACLHGHAAKDATPVKPGTEDQGDETPVGDTGANAEDPEEGQADLGCDTRFSNPLTWVICPVVDMLEGMVGFIDSLITDRMTIETDSIFCDTGDKEAYCNAYYEAWKAFRNIAIGLMVIVGLVILISQVIGMDILDAYTIRKALPRLLVAALLITLSWPLMRFAVELTNDLGLGIRSLIYSPFADLGANKLDLSFDNGILGTIGNTIIGTTATAGSLVWLASGGIMILLSLAGTAALAVFVAIMVLILREIIIILLMLIAPIALIAYVLPNTNKFYKLWWESFSKALLMFPFIAALIATGHVFSAIAIGSGGLLNQFIGFIAYFAPYFLIPLTIKFAGGFMRQVGGFVSDRSKGGFDRLAKYRANRRQQMGQDIHAGQALRMLGPGKPGSVRDRINTGLQAASMAGAAGINPRYWRGNVSEQMRKYDAQKRAGSDNEEEMATINGYDDLARAVTETGGNLNEMDAFLLKRGVYDDNTRKQMLTAWTVARKGMEKKGYSHDAILQSVMLSGLKAKTAYRDKFLDYDEDGNYIGGGRIANDIARLSGGNRGTMAQMVGRASEITKAAGRQDELPGFSDTFDAVIALTDATPANRADVLKAQSQKMLQKSLYKEGLSAFVAGTAHATRHLKPVLRQTLAGTVSDLDSLDKWEDGMDLKIEVYDEATGKVAEHKVDKNNRDTLRRSVQRNQNQVVAQLLSLQDVNGNLPPEKQALVANLLNESIGTNEKGQAITVQEFINNKRIDPEVNQFRSDYRFITGSDSEIEARANTDRNRGNDPGGTGIPPVIRPPTG